MKQLEPSGKPVRVGAFTVRSPGLRGKVVTRPVTKRPTRGGTAVDAGVASAIAASGARIAGVLELVDLSVVAKGPGGGRARRGAATAGAALEIEVPAPGADEVHALLGVDGLGVDAVYRWSYPPPAGAQPGRAARAGAAQAFSLPLPLADSPPGDRSARGIGGAIGRKVVAWVVFPLARRVVGKGGKWLTARWEAEHRPSRVRSFTPTNWCDRNGADLTKEEWGRLTVGRALLVVHGTMDRASSSFGAMPKKLVDRLHKDYGGRVFAFDHPTLSVDPLENATWFAKQLGRSLPRRAVLDLDVLSSSRGGLVSRELAVRPDRLPLGDRQVEVRRLVMMAPPNQGTVLADTKHMRAFLDTFTNLLRFIPDNGVTDVLEVVLEIVKQVASGVVEGLPGLQAMHPKGEYLKTLNCAGGRPVEYYSLASDYEPGGDGFGRWASDAIIDAIFKGAENDLVVPVAGVWGKNRAPGFPLADGAHIELRGQHITHGGFFRSQDTMKALGRWLVP